MNIIAKLTYETIFQEGERNRTGDYPSITSLMLLLAELPMGSALKNKLEDHIMDLELEVEKHAYEQGFLIGLQLALQEKNGYK